MSTTSEHVIIWQFSVRPGQEADFETAYGPKGEWAKLFALSADYLGTVLLRNSADPRCYMTIDRWASAAAFRLFRETHEADYGALDAKCGALTEAEVASGSWMPVWP